MMAVLHVHIIVVLAIVLVGVLDGGAGAFLSLDALFTIFFKLRYRINTISPGVMFLLALNVEVVSSHVHV